ncbi:hypothetical protein C8J57DRAFT_1717886 [Mycena rebaudengoi]|nr:hypothetical protein C8J57DRAFT_1717886 [Mycena rebaudengoi]
MAILKLYGSPIATCVATVLHELKVPFELIEVKIMEGEHKTPPKQPFGQIPYIDDDGFILYETRGLQRQTSLRKIDSSPLLNEDRITLEPLLIFTHREMGWLYERL